MPPKINGIEWMITLTPKNAEKRILSLLKGLPAIRNLPLPTSITPESPRRKSSSSIQKSIVNHTHSIKSSWFKAGVTSASTTTSATTTATTSNTTISSVSVAPAKEHVSINEVEEVVMIIDADDNKEKLHDVQSSIIPKIVEVSSVIVVDTTTNNNNNNNTSNDEAVMISLSPKKKTTTEMIVTSVDDKEGKDKMISISTLRPATTTTTTTITTATITTPTTMTISPTSVITKSIPPETSIMDMEKDLSIKEKEKEKEKEMIVIDSPIITKKRAATNEPPKKETLIQQKKARKQDHQKMNENHGNRTILSYFKKG
jgi:hypothetical protein